ncbi:MAG: hypothetical protein KGM99_18090 [Burkholderiales bacterium]|nr:hypothetical protein [Burkholderiales bacterium]
MTSIPEQLQPHLGSIFRVETTIGDIHLKLEEIDVRPRRGLPDNFPTPILLIFSGSGKTLLNQDNYIVNHSHLGQKIWLIAPVMPDFAKGQHLQLHEDGSRCMFYQSYFC